MTGWGGWDILIKEEAMATVLKQSTDDKSINTAMQEFIRKKKEAEFFKSLETSVAQADNGQLKDAFESFDRMTKKLESRKQTNG